jgi:hypothetical protein
MNIYYIIILKKLEKTNNDRTNQILMIMYIVGNGLIYECKIDSTSNLVKMYKK